jgi:hypothetical protein
VDSSNELPTNLVEIIDYSVPNSAWVQVVVGSNLIAADQLIPRESAANAGQLQVDFFVLIPRYLKYRCGDDPGSSESHPCSTLEKMLSRCIF